jgi:hypothetical protein
MDTSMLGVIIAIRVAGSINGHGQNKSEPPALRRSHRDACAPQSVNLLDAARIAVADCCARLRVAIAVMRTRGRTARGPRSGWARALSEVSLVTTKTAR